MKSTPFEALVLHAWAGMPDHLVVSVPIFLTPEKDIEEYIPVAVINPRGDDVQAAWERILALRVTTPAAEIIEQFYAGFHTPTETP